MRLVGPALMAAAVAALPPPSFRVSGYPLDASGSGPRVAVVTSECAIRVANLAVRRAPTTVRQPAVCREPDTFATSDGVWLGRSWIAVQTLDAESPHGEDDALWVGPLPRGPLRQVGDDWGWTDSDIPSGYGCAWSVAAGGGVVALTKVPNTLGIEHGSDTKPACPAGPSTTIVLLGAPRKQLKVAGSWSVLGTDGRRILLAQLDRLGDRTGALAFVKMDGTRLPGPAVPRAVAANAWRAWLDPDGLVLETSRGATGPGWTVRYGGSAAVGYGRLLYAKGRTLRVRRIRGGADRAVATLPSSEASIAAGAFGVAIAAGAENTSVYRLAWSTIDRILPQRR